MMDARKQVNVVYDEASDCFDLGALPILDFSSCSSIIISLVIVSSDEPVETSQVYKLSVEPPATLRIVGANSDLAIAFEAPEMLAAFVHSHWVELLDLAVANATRLAPDEDLLWVGGDKLRSWVLFFTTSNAGRLAEVVSRPPFVDFSDGLYRRLDLSNFVDSPGASAAQHVFEVFRDSHDGLALPETFPLLLPGDTSSSTEAKRLVIKLQRSAFWFLKVPMDYFAQHKGFGRISSYAEIEWVVTGKSLCRVAQERANITRELSNLSNLLRHSVFIINTYSHFDEQCTTATEPELEVLRLFDSVNVQEGGAIETLHLRYFFNPGVDEVEEILKDPDTWFVFADFHVECSTWALGVTQGLFDLECFERNSLSHVRLMRIYHCNSIFDSYDPEALGETIVNKLLSAGATRVEGSVVKENYLSFLREVVRILLGTSGARPIVAGQCLVEGKSFKDLIQHLEQVLGLPAEPTPA